jgi:hypothetical protein
MGIVCVLLFFCFGIGYLIALVYGWMKSSEWGIAKIMMIWTGAIIAGIICRAIAAALGAGLTMTGA